MRKNVSVRIISILLILLVVIMSATGCAEKKNDSAEEAETNLFVHGLVAVKNDEGQWGYINEQGEMVIEPQFNQAHGFAPNGLARVGVQDSCVSQKFGYINEKGELAHDIKFSDAGDFDENGLAIVSRGEPYKIELIDSNANIVYDGNCWSITKFVNGYAWAAKKNKSIKIDLEGNELMTVKGQAATQFDDGYTILLKGEDKCCCIINSEGQQIGAEYKEIYKTNWDFESDAGNIYMDKYY